MVTKKSRLHIASEITAAAGMGLYVDTVVHLSSLYLCSGAYVVDSVDVLNLSGVSGDPSAAVHDQQNR